MAGAGTLLDAAAGASSAPTCACIAAPCVGRCEQAPVGGRAPACRAACRCATRWPQPSARRPTRIRPPQAGIAFAPATCAERGVSGQREAIAIAPALRRLRDLPRRRRLRAGRGGRRRPQRPSERCIAAHGGLRPARPRRRRLSGRPQVAHRARAAGAAPDGGQHRRRRARHFQGPHLPRARSAPLPRGAADRRRTSSASTPATSTCATNTTAAARSSRPSSPSCRRDPPCPLPRIELRRGAGAYICGEESAMIESIEGQARRAAPAAALHRAGRPVRPADARAQLRDALLGARHRRARPGVVRRLRPPRPQGPAQLQRQRPREAARREAGAGRHHAARAGRRILRRHAPTATSSMPICPAAPPAASCRPRMADIPLDFDTLQPHGCFIGSAAVIVLGRPRPRARRGAQHDEVLRRTRAAASARPAASAPSRRRR